jgi:rod shape determining protein RodA
MLRIDPLLFLATLGLCAFGIYTIYTATSGDIQGSPYYYVIRQGVYAGVGVLLMLIVSRFDYSRLREWRWGIYGLLLATILMTLALGTASHGSKRWINFPFFNFQPSELGKVLLTLALAGFLVDRTRRLGEAETTARIMLLTVIPAMLVIAQPDLGSGFVYIAIALALLFAGHEVDALRGPRHARRGGSDTRAGGGADGRRSRDQGVPGAAPHGVRAPDGQPARAGLSAQAVHYRDRLR